jgi:hypothetical protein
MSVQLIAKELYRLIQEVEEMEERISAAPYEKREEMRFQLLKSKADRDHMRKILDGRKDAPAHAKRYHL